MSFGINSHAPFQRAMEITFIGLINKFIILYIDDITIVSKKRVDHIHHLK